MFQKWFYEEENYSVTLLRTGIKKKGLEMFKGISVGFPMVFLCVGRVALH
jgi:hypothetical protein